MMQEPYPNLIVHNRKPLNAETPLHRLRQNFITPVDDFYIRTHGEIPRLAPATHRLTVSGDGIRPLQLGLDEIQSRFKRKTVTATLQCAGNRRADMLTVRQVSGEAWAPGAIGTAEWTGAVLADILATAGVQWDSELHIAFEGADSIELESGTTHFGGSIPIAKAMREHVLLAYAMNGRPLSAEHGGPLRAVVPGHAGARSVKWLTGVTVQRQPSQNFYQQHEYKLFPASMRADTANYEDGMMIYEMPLNSAICDPAPWQSVQAGRCTLRGYAIAGERSVSRVEVSINGGREWLVATLNRPSDQPGAWTFWEAEVEIDCGTHELAVRAWDSAGQTQPALPDDAWNFKGYLCASWHRVWIKAVH